MEKVGQGYQLQSIDNAYLESALFYMNFWGHVVKNNSIFHQWWIRECKGLADKFYLALLKKKKWEGYYLGDEKKKQLWNSFYPELIKNSFSMPILHSQIVLPDWTHMSVE